MPVPMIPPQDVCERARKARDARFDGLFFTAVRSTHIYCRVSCPAPAPKPQNIVYFATAAAASAAGYRPCLRCRPELAPQHATRGADAAGRALALINSGWLQDESVEGLARRVGISPRQLRRLCVERTGASPLALHSTRRLLLARQLIVETNLPMTQVAAAAGFDSLRRFNAAFKEACRIAPSKMRRQPASCPPGSMRLRLGYRPPFDFGASLLAMRHRALPGIEMVDALGYQRAVGPANLGGAIRVTHSADRPELELEIKEVSPIDLEPIVRQVRRMFDLDADLAAAGVVLEKYQRVRHLLRVRPGLRIAGMWDGFECAVSTVLGGVDSDTCGAAVMRNMIDLFGGVRPLAPEGIALDFPSAAVLAVADLELAGLKGEQGACVRDLARAVSDGRIDFFAGQRLEDFVRAMVGITSMPEAMAYEVAMLALGEPDAVPLAVAPSEHDESGTPLASCRPWRSYACLHLAHETHGRLPTCRNATTRSAASVA